MIYITSTVVDQCFLLLCTPLLLLNASLGFVQPIECPLRFTSFVSFRSGLLGHVIQNQNSERIIAVEEQIG